MLFSPLANLAALILCIAGCLFAFVKGGVPERIGGGVILANLVLGSVSHSYIGNEVVDLCIDGLTATALLILALRYAAVWQGAAMLIFAVQFGLNAFYLVLERPADHLHDIVNNADSLAVSICLIVGTVLAWRRRGAGSPATLSAEAAP
jgi:hypothetical protein